MAAPISGVLMLEPRQNQLHSALKTKDEVLARMYFSALQVFSQVDNEDRFYLTAHAIRELMKKLPLVIDVPLVEGANQRLGDFVQNVNQVWETMCSKNRWPGNPKWQGEIDNDLKKVLNKIESMLIAQVKIRKSRKLVIKSVLRKQNYSEVPLPSDIEELRTEEWIKYDNYFTGTAHYRFTDEITFLSYLKHFEIFLLNCLEPRTFEVQADIKKIIEEGESNAN